VLVIDQAVTLVLASDGLFNSFWQATVAISAGPYVPNSVHIAVPDDPMLSAPGFSPGGRALGTVAGGGGNGLEGPEVEVAGGGAEAVLVVPQEPLMQVVTDWLQIVPAPHDSTVAVPPAPQITKFAQLHGSA